MTYDVEVVFTVLSVEKGIGEKEDFWLLSNIEIKSLIYSGLLN
jgi:hypothetical protein